MDKLARRVRHAERRVGLRNKKTEKLQAKSDRKERLEYTRRVAKAVHQDKVAERAALREQWLRGPLAPKLDIGDGSYRTMDRERAHFNVSRNPSTVARRCAWAGGPRQLCLVPGDRVVILHGPDQGKIDHIDEINLDTGTLTLKTQHRITFRMPGWLREAVAKQGQGGSAGDGKESTGPADLPISSVRLVYPLPDPATGTYRDVVVRELVPMPMPYPLPERVTFEQWEHGKRYDRMVPGINVRIPWPRAGAPKHDAHAADTPRIAVEERTFVPTLLSPPMPAEVIDELRGRYSKFRTRHEPWYVARKEAEALEKRLVARTTDEMRTPLTDFNRSERDSRRARGEPHLSDDMLEKIGRIVERNRLADVALGAAAKAVRDGGIARVTAAMAKHAIVDAGVSAEADVRKQTP